MTTIEIKEFYEHQIEWYKRQIAWDTEQIEWYTRQLERSRKEDREFIEWVQQNPNYTEEEKERIKGYVSKETKENLAYRKRYYTQRKRDRKNLIKYEMELANLK